ncbi:MAG TPA: sialidase family protein [Candidatus Limnocylindrales bacterium]|nr:sialidase family protein [Candidatus Limnocylindrales bacterium]
MHSLRIHAPRRLATALAAAGLLVGMTGGLALADDDQIQPVAFSHNVMDAPAPVNSAVFGTDGSLKPGQLICTGPTSTAANVNTDCEATPGPHNETSIAVNPTDHDNIIGGANDYQLGLNNGGHVTETVRSRAHVTVDGGQTWSEYPILFTGAYQATGDPSVAFDAAGHAYYATLGFRFVGPANVQAPDVLVANSGDGGRTWTSKVVAHGSGNFGSVGQDLDKEYVAAWGDGNAIVVFGNFIQGQQGSFLAARIYSSVTHDGGATWSSPVVISGDLDEAFVAIPTITPDGRIFVSFLNTGDLTTGRDTYEVVEVSPSSGARLAGPVDVALVIDGATDYPLAFGRQTYQDSTFRSWAAGNITADPANPGHLAVVWSDMRNSVTPAPGDPYSAVTNSDVIVSESTDYGQTWSAPQAIALAGDQWMPWGAFDAAGTLRIGTFDRSSDPANHLYDYSLLSQTGPSSYARSVVSTVSSDPTQGNRWFATTLNPDFPHPTSFLGDYSNIAVVPGTTHVVAYWTDLREQACFAGTCASGEDAYFAYAS